MPNKVRIVVEIEGSWRTGKAARKTVDEWVNSDPERFVRAHLIRENRTIPRWQQTVELFKLVPSLKKQIYVYREPRHNSIGTSRYIQLRKAVGIGRRVARKPKATPGGLPTSLRSLQEAQRSVRFEDGTIRWVPAANVTNTAQDAQQLWLESTTRFGRPTRRLVPTATGPLEFQPPQPITPPPVTATSTRAAERTMLNALDAFLDDIQEDIQESEDDPR